jgi:hypothetical protein
MSTLDDRDEPAELIYFGTPASGTRMMGLSITTVAKLASIVIVAMVVIGLGDGIARVVVCVALALGGLALLVTTLVLRLHPVAWLKMTVGARLNRSSNGVAVDAQLLRCPGSRQLVAGLAVLGETPSLGLRARPDQGEAWAQLLNEASNRLPPHGEFVLRSSILPQTLREDLSQRSDVYRELALDSYTVSTSLLVTSPPGSQRRQRVAVTRTMAGLQTLSQLDRVSLAPPNRPSELIDGSCGAISRSFSAVGAKASEEVEMLVGEEFVASTYLVEGWPGRSVDPRMLLPFFAPGPPSRVVSLVVRPLESRRAQRHVARHRTEMVADRRLRRERGYLDRARDEYREATALTQEEELLAGYRLCRYQLLVVLLAPSAQRLLASRAALDELAASAQLQLSLCLGAQRSRFEQAILGVTRWS